MLRTVAGRVCGILALVVVLCPALPVLPPESASAHTGEAGLVGGGG